MAVYFCDTDCELWYTTVKELGMGVIQMPYTIDGEEYLYDFGENTDLKGFFKKMEAGSSASTSAQNEAYYTKLGSLIGRIFQNQDDLFDQIKTEQEMGKNLSDAKNNKGTALSVYSLQELKDLIDEEFVQLDRYLEKATFDTSYLKDILKKLKER